MKIGCIYVGYNTEDMIIPSLAPWVEARKSRLGGHEYLIAAVSVPFVGFDTYTRDQTHLFLKAHVGNSHIDHLMTSDTPMKETEARGQALRWLVEQGCDAVVQVDSDEFYTLDEISRIFAFVESRPHIAAFRGSLKNYVEANGERVYLVDAFTPMRIHRVRLAGYQASSFYDDNNVLYRGTLTRDMKRDIDFAVAQIPKACAWVRHESWPSNARGKAKVEYQVKTRGWQCSFQWNYELDRLEWNPALPVPETARDLT